EQLLKTNAELEQFAYVSSHDLQEPLRKIQTFTELVSNNLDKKDVARKYLDKIDTSASRMAVLIKGVLSYSRLTHSADHKTVDLDKVLKSVLDDYELLIGQKNGRINSEKLPVVQGIELQMFQLFSNLINNSLKFSEREPVINISVKQIPLDDPRLQALDHARRFVEIEFRDNGIGFDSKYSDKIFTLFQRLNNRRDYEGTGIGLALCKKIVDNHGGAITVESTAGEGSTFKVLLPSEP
ncbi:MAG: ATP-binding protein, partial [Bacteroidota bacterium]|nr:ATP-binding protein [Bacteroidota bacterium]